MAKTSAFLLSIFVIASFSSVSHGLSISIDSAQIQGVLRCTLNASVTAPPVAGATVGLTCPGSNTLLVPITTNLAGIFTIQLGTTGVLLPDLLSCLVTVNLPVATCSVFPLNGVLNAPISLLNVVPTSVGFIVNFLVGTFVPSL